MERLVKAANRSDTAIVSRGLNGDKKLAKGIKKTQKLRQPRNTVGAVDASTGAQKKHGLMEGVTIIMARVSTMLTSSLKRYWSSRSGTRRPNRTGNRDNPPMTHSRSR